MLTQEPSKPVLFAFVLVLVVQVTGPSCKNSGGYPEEGVRSPAHAKKPALDLKATKDPFARWLKSARLVFKPAPGYEKLPVKANSRWTYLHAMRSKTSLVEIRFGGPSGELAGRLDKLCQANKCHQGVPAKKVVQQMLRAAYSSMAKNGTVERVKDFPSDSVREEFNALWGGVVAFDADPRFAPAKRGVGVFIHREGYGSGMFVGLYDKNSSEMQSEWMQAFHALKFNRPIGDPKSRKLSEPLRGSVWQCDKAGTVQMRFRRSTWAIIHISVAMAGMGIRKAYETIFHDVTYGTGSFKAKIYRVDNMEQGDRTPANPVERTYKYTLGPRKLTLHRQPSGTSGKPGKPWSCTLLGRR